MNFFNFDLKKLIMLAIILILPLVSINMQQRPQDSNWLAKPFSFVAASVENIFYNFSNGVKSTTALYVNLIDIKKNSQTLNEKNQELETRLAAMSELEVENARLKSLLDFKQAHKMDLIGAQVISRDLLVDHNTVTINKGTFHGLKSGQAVITINGVLGYIFRPNTYSSQVMLITDRYSVVDGIVQRTRARGIVEGKNQGECTLKYVEKTEDVKPGDLVVTGGLDNIFPKGFPVAIVEAVERKNFSVSLKVDLRPVVDPNKIEEVFVVKNAAELDFGDRFTADGELAPAAPSNATSSPNPSPAAPHTAPTAAPPSTPPSPTAAPVKTPAPTPAPAPQQGQNQ